MTTLTSKDVGDATNQELAACILQNADSTPIGNSFVVTSAVELAKRIMPDIKQADVSENTWNKSKSQGFAQERKLKSMKKWDL